MRNRIREIRLAKGLRLEEVAERAKITHQYLSRLERGLRTLSTDKLAAIAGAMDCTASELLLPGEGQAEATVPVVGRIQADEKIDLYPDDEIVQVKPPPGAERTHAVRVVGDSLWPVYGDGDILFYEPTEGVGEEAIGRECIVKVKRGQLLIKRVSHSHSGLFRLSSHKVPDVDAVCLDWAAKVKWIQRA